MAGGEARRERLPFYLLGEYRHEGGGQGGGDGDKRGEANSPAVAVSMALRRGDREPASAKKVGLRADEAAAFVRQAASDLLAGAGGAGAAAEAAADPAIEAGQLSARAAQSCDRATGTRRPR